MNIAKSLLVAAGWLGLLGGAAAAQDQEKQDLRKKILEEVEKRLKQEEERLLKDLEKLLEEELGKKPQPAPPPVPPKPEPPKPPPPKPEPPTPEPPKPAPQATKARGFLGIRVAELSDEDRKAPGVKGGLRVVDVVEGGPAAKAGVQAGDILTALDGRAIDTPQELPAIIQAAGAGAKVKLEILRDGKKQTLTATLDRHPSDPAPAEPPKREEPKKEGAPGDLRDRIRKFLERPEPPKAQDPKGEAPSDFLPAIDPDLFDQLKEKLDPLGVDLDQFFEKGKDGKFRLNESYRDILKGLDLRRFFGDEPKAEPGKPAPPAAPAGRPWLGLQPEDVPDDLRAKLDLEEGVGLLVAEVVPDSPAEKAGLKKGDVLVRIDGKPAKGEEALAAFMRSARPGQEATLTILRQGKEQALKVTLAQRKE